MQMFQDAVWEWARAEIAEVGGHHAVVKAGVVPEPQRKKSTISQTAADSPAPIAPRTPSAACERRRADACARRRRDTRRSASCALRRPGGRSCPRSGPGEPRAPRRPAADGAVQLIHGLGDLVMLRIEFGDVDGMQLRALGGCMGLYSKDCSAVPEYRSRRTGYSAGYHGRKAGGCPESRPASLRQRFGRLRRGLLVLALGVGALPDGAGLQPLLDHVGAAALGALLRHGLAPGDELAVGIAVAAVERLARAWNGAPTTSPSEHSGHFTPMVFCLTYLQVG